MSDKLVPDKLGRHGHVTTGAGRDFPQFPTVYIHNTETDKSIRTPISVNLYMPLAHANTRHLLRSGDFYECGNVTRRDFQFYFGVSTSRCSSGKSICISSSFCMVAYILGVDSPRLRRLAPRINRTSLNRNRISFWSLG